MISLSTYEDKDVVIQTNNGKVYRGNVNYYFYPEDNEDGQESIAIRDYSSGLLVNIGKSEIKSIEIIK